MPERNRDNGAFKVLVTDKIDPEGLAVLSGKPGLELVMAVGKKPAELSAVLPSVAAWLVRSETRIDEAALTQASKLKLIGRAGVGIDNIDVAGASRRGIAVINSPQANTLSACEHTWALLLALARNVPAADRALKDGGWDRSRFSGIELAGKTLGLVGLGRIGREVAKRALAFSMRVLAYDPYISQEQAKGIGVELMGLKDLLGASDFLSLHVPSSPKTKGLINSESLGWVKKGARLVNCARGDLIEESALLASLKDGRLTGAALDVFDEEPLPKDSALRSAPNLVLTPHLGASTAEAQRKAAEDLAQGVLEFYEKGLARNAINLPGFDADTLEALGPSLELADKLGRFLGQMLDAGLKGIECSFAGDFQASQRHPLSVAALKGALSIILEQTLSFVNAPILALERGIEISDSASSSAPEGFSRLMTITAVTDKGSRSVAGTIGTGGEPRIVRMDELFVDVSPRGRMIVLTNTDRPGVIGAVGTLLGERGVNIADMRVGRRSPKGEAVMVITVDEEVSEELRKELARTPGITSARRVVL